MTIEEYQIAISNVALKQMRAVKKEKEIKIVGHMHKGSACVVDKKVFLANKQTGFKETLERSRSW